MSIRFKSKLLIATIFLFSLPGFAAKRMALVIGNSNYQTLPALHNPHHDATKVAARLQELGFDVTLKENLDAYDLRAEVAYFSNNIDRDTEVSLLFYAGHGVEIAGKSYLLPVDLRFDTNRNLKSDQAYTIGGIEADKLIAQIAHAGAQTNIMVFDACRSLPTRGLNSFRIANQRYLGTLIAYSAQSGQAANDGIAGQNSPYTQALLKHLGTPNWGLFQTFNAVNREINSQQQVAEMNVTSIDDVILNPAADLNTNANSNPAVTTTPNKPPVNDDTWMQKLWAWADEFQIPEEELPRNKKDLLSMEELVILREDWRNYGKNHPKITYLPAEIGQLSNLKKIEMDYNKLTALPDSIGQLSNLQKLYIRENQLTTLPKNINQLQKLKLIWIVNNPLVKNKNFTKKIQQWESNGVRVYQ